MINKPLSLFFLLCLALFLCSCNYPYQPKQFVLPAPNYIFPSKSALMDFIGTGATNVKLAFTLKNSVREVYYLDYSEYNDTAFNAHKLKSPGKISGLHSDSPLISPDGTFVTFYLTNGASANGAYIQRLDTLSEPVLIAANGTEPHWYRDESGVYVIYSNILSVDLGNLKKGIGQTFKQKVDLAGSGSVSGIAQVIAPYPMNGGLSSTGQFLCTGYLNSAFYDITNASLIMINQGLQTCNPSIDPDTAHPGWMMFLNFVGTQNMTNPFIGAPDYPISKVLEHSMLYIVDQTNTVKDYVPVSQLSSALGNYSEWQDPEWSNNPAFATALGVLDDAQADGIIIKNIGNRTIEKKFLRFTLGKGKLDITSTPYLWIEK